MRTKQMKAFILAAIFAFESMVAGYVSVSAQTMPQNSIIEAVETVQITSETAVAEVDVISETAVAEENIAAETATVSHNGTDGDLSWSIDTDGHLTVSGNGDYEARTARDHEKGWLVYRDEIKSATVNVSGITNTGYMFYGCDNLESLDVTGFDTSNVTDMSGMFSGCNSLTNLDLSNFQTGNVKNMQEMFGVCNSLTSLNLKGFDTSKVTNMYRMFYNCQKLESLDLSGFQTGNVTNMSAMFMDCIGLTELKLDKNNFNTANVADMSSMFSSCSSLTSLDVSGFKTRCVTNMVNMFWSCENLTSLNLSNFDTMNVTDMDYMFGYCYSLTSLDISNFNTTNVTNMSGMFADCSKLKNIYAPENKTQLDMALPTVENCTWIYQPTGETVTAIKEAGTYLLVKYSGVDGKLNWNINLDGHLTVSGNGDYDSRTAESQSGWLAYKDEIKSVSVNATGITNTGYMFYGCSNLENVDLSDLDTKSVTDMNHMFGGCSGLTSLDLSEFKTENVTSMVSMFDGCQNLTSLDLSSFSFKAGLNTEYFWQSCEELQKITMPKDVTTEISLYTPSGYAWMDESGAICTSSTMGLEVPMTYTRISADSQYIESVILKPAEAILDKGVTFALEETVTATQTISDPVLTWTSDNENVATVDSGVVTTVGYGAATITVATENLKKATCRITVQAEAPAATLDLSLTEVELAKGAQKQLTAVATGGYTDSVLVWKSSDETIATVSDSGLVKAVGVGSTTITASFAGVTKICTVTVNVPISSVTLNKSALTLEKGNSETLTATVLPADTTESTTVTWTSSNEAVATVTSAGAVTAVGAGSATITASCGGKSATCDVTVTDANLLYYGTDGDLKWSIDQTGLLTVSGNGDYEERTSSDNEKGWLVYKDEIKSATVKVSGITNTGYMFYGCDNLESLDVSGLDTREVTDMRWMFCYCSNLESLDVSGFDTRNVTYMHGMFCGCSSLASLDLSSLETSNVTEMSNMFYGCSSLTSLNLSGFETSNAADMNFMFYECSSLTSLDVSSFDTGNVTSMRYTFFGCSSLASLDLSSLETSNVTDMSCMFSDCNNLHTIHAPENKSTVDMELPVVENCAWTYQPTGETVTVIHKAGTYIKGAAAGNNTDPGEEKPVVGDNTDPKEEKPVVGNNTDPKEEKPVVEDNNKPEEKKPVVEKDTETKKDGSVVKTEKTTYPEGNVSLTIISTSKDTKKQTRVDMEIDADKNLESAAIEVSKKVGGKSMTINLKELKQMVDQIEKCNVEYVHPLADGVDAESILTEDGLSGGTEIVSIEDDFGYSAESSSVAGMSLAGKSQEDAWTDENITWSDELYVTAKKANISIKVTAKDNKGKDKYSLSLQKKDLSQKKFVVYSSDKKGNPVMTNPKSNNVKVNAKKDMTIKIASKGNYQLQNTKDAAKTNQKIMKTVAPKKTNVTVKQGSSTKFGLSAKCNKANISKITYKADNSNVKVTGSGKISAKSSGTSKVTANVTMKNGAKKSIKMKVSVS